MCLFLFSAVVSMMAIPTDAAGEGEIEDRIFHNAAQWRGEEYVRARDMLIKRGEAIVPMLRQKLKSNLPNERLFARILLARIEKPEEIIPPRYSLGDPISATMTKMLESYQDFTWINPPPEPLDVTTVDVVDKLWQYATDNGGNNDKIPAAALQFYLAPDIEATGPMMEIVAVSQFSKFAEEGILKLGRQAIPKMREVLDGIGPAPVPVDLSNPTPEEKKERLVHGRQISRARVAAYVLSHLSDRDSIPRIAKCLKDSGLNNVSISQSLVRLGAVNEIGEILVHLNRQAVKRMRDNDRWNQDVYGSLRKCVTDLGRPVLPALEIRRISGIPESEQIILDNLILKLKGIEGKPKQVAELRESLLFDQNVADLMRLHELTGEDIYKQLCRFAFSSFDSEENAPAQRALVKLKEVRAIPRLAEQLQSQHEWLGKQLAERETKPGAQPFDAQRAREVGYTFDRRETYTAKILAVGDTMLRTLRGIGGPKARKAIEAALEYPEYKARANISLMVVDGDMEGLAKSLTDPSRAVREEAAFALHEAGDARATVELFLATARRQGPAHEKWKQYALSSTEDIAGSLRKLTESEDLRVRVLAQAMVFEAENPEKAAICKTSLHGAAQNIGMMHVIRIGMVEGTGRGLVADETDTPPEENKDDGPLLLNREVVSPLLGIGRARIVKLDDSYIPMVEAECLFRQGVIRRGVAAFALAQWKRPRSMPVLAASMNMGSLGGSNPAAMALADFGEAGAKLAADVPAPQPGEHDTGLRMTMHRGGTRVLAEQKDVRGVDEILKGLKTLEEDESIESWGYRARIYLNAAGKYHDKRLVEPLVRILEADGYRQNQINSSVIPLLAAYEDERIVPLLFKRLTTRQDYYSKDYEKADLYEVAIEALTRQLGAETPEYLIEQYRQTKDASQRGAILLALGELSFPEYPEYPGEGRWSTDRLKTLDERKQAASKTRKLAYPLLLAALEDPSEQVNYMAALGLTIFAQGSRYVPARSDTETVDALARWCVTQKRSIDYLTKYLGDYGDQETGQALLEVLRSSPAHKTERQLAEAIGKLKPEGAVDVLTTKVRAIYLKYKKPYRTPSELHALAEFGEDGLAAAQELFEQVNSLSCQLAIAELLSRNRYQPAAESLEKLVRETIEAGPNNPKLVPASSSETKAETYIRRCKSLFESLHRLNPAVSRKIARKVVLNGPDLLRPAFLTWLTD